MYVKSSSHSRHKDTSPAAADDIPIPKNDAEYIARYEANREIARALSTKINVFKPQCVRNLSNWSGLIDRANAINLIELGTDFMRFEHMSPERRNMMEDLIHISSPKAHKLIETIDRLDAEDMRAHGKHFKHFIFTDLKSRKYGIDILASALILNDWHLGYEAEPIIADDADGNPVIKKYTPIQLKTAAQLRETAGRNFFILTSRTIFKQPIKVATRREILAKFNERPANVYGEEARIIIMDSGFKEGIDLFDIKYIHVFEPQETVADMKQVVGRGTRTCGQKGLPFDPTEGWPLHIYLYDLAIDTDLSPLFLGSQSAFELYQRSKGVNLLMYNFIGQIEEVLGANAVDAVLTAPVHGRGKAGRHRPASASALEDAAAIAAVKSYTPPETAPKTADDLRDYVRREYGGEFTWETPKVENGCVGSAAAAAATAPTQIDLLNFTMTQGFIANYFTPANFAKGMLLWHSVGTGKTCTAIATASKSFEQAGYTILWVTRTTLRADVWKNIFGAGASCHAGVRAFLAANGILPDKFADQRRLLSKAWKIQPISYKQFTNLIERKNDIYKKMAAINGDADPLRKTLLIIDEAHKLYGVSDLSTIERPNMDKLHAALMNSYIVSGADSCRLLAMTATPITSNPMEIVQLLNLMRPLSDQLPAFFANFSAEYLNADGVFTAAGERAFCDATAGYVSYLNLEKDIRKFAQPILHRVTVPMVEMRDVMEFDRVRASEYYRHRIAKVDQRISELTMFKHIRPKTVPRHIVAAMKTAAGCDAEKGDIKKGCAAILKANMAAFKADFRMEYDRLMNELAPLREKKRRLVDEKKETGDRLRQLEKEIPAGYRLGPFNQIKRKCKLPGRNADALEYRINSNAEIVRLNAEIDGLVANEVQTADEIKILKMGIARLRRLIKKHRDDVTKIAEPMAQLNAELKVLSEKTKDLRDIRKDTKSIRQYGKYAVGKVQHDIKDEIKAELRVIKKYEVFTNKLDAQMKQFGAVGGGSSADSIAKKMPLMMEIGDNIADVVDAGSPVIMQVLDGMPLDSVAELKRLDDEVRTIGMGAEELYRHYVAKTAREVARFKRGFRCPDGKVFNGETGKCVASRKRAAAAVAAAASVSAPKTRKQKPCPEGKIRNPITGRCITRKARTPTPSVSTRTTSRRSKSSIPLSTQAVYSPGRQAHM